MKTKYKILALAFFILAILLRVMLCHLNPPSNAFDNHFEPISLIMWFGKIPEKFDCWECVQPPVFYVISAKISNLALHMGVDDANIRKLIQYTCCFYGILTLVIIYLILSKFRLSDFSKILTFGLICFLPRHIYMSAMLSNDTLSYLLVAICIYLLMIAIEQEFSIRSLIMLSLFMTITIFTKYNSLVVIPLVVTVFMLALRQLPAVDRKKKAIFFCLALLTPLAILGSYMAGNVKNYGSVFPGNYEVFSYVTDKQPRDPGGISFFTFKPWQSLETPILAPGKLNSFWTLIHSGMWFDTEPKFLYFINPDKTWWDSYYGWLKGDNNYPKINHSMSKLTALVGSSLIMLGIIPLLIFTFGIYYYYSRLFIKVGEIDWKEKTKMLIFPLLIICNTVGIIAIILRLPVFSTVKASYFLISMPAFAIFHGQGLMAGEKQHLLKRAIIIIYGILFALGFLHIVHICSFLYRIS